MYFAVNVDVAPKCAATAFGIMNLAFAISGFLAPVITGSVLKLHGSFVDAFWLMTGLAFSPVIVVLIFIIPIVTGRSQCWSSSAVDAHIAGARDRRSGSARVLAASTHARAMLASGECRLRMSIRVAVRTWSKGSKRP